MKLVFVAVSKAAVALISPWAVQYKFSDLRLATVRCEEEPTLGLTLPHVSGVPDIKQVPGVGYTSLSEARARSDLNFLCSPETDFFKPPSVL